MQEKTPNITPFQAHFGRKPNTPLGNIYTSPDSTILSYEQISNLYLDRDRVPVADYLDDNGLVSDEISDIVIKEAMTRAQADAVRHYSGEKINQYLYLLYTQNSLIRFPAKKTC